MIPLGVLASPRVSAGGGSLAIAYGGSAQDPANSTSYTFADIPVGPASADRTVVAAIGIRSASFDVTPPTVTIGGVAATIDATDNAMENSGRTMVAIARAALPTGTTATVTVAIGTAGVRATCACWAITGGAVAVAGTVKSTAAPVTLTPTPSDGPVYVATAAQGSTAGIAWSGVTQDASLATPEGNWEHRVGHSTTGVATVSSPPTTVSAAVAYTPA